MFIIFANGRNLHILTFCFHRPVVSRRRKNAGCHRGFVYSMIFNRINKFKKKQYSEHDIGEITQTKFDEILQKKKSRLAVRFLFSNIFKGRSGWVSVQ